MTTKPGKFDFLADERQQRPSKDDTRHDLNETVEDAQASKSTNAQASKGTNTQRPLERRPSGQRIRSDLLRSIKILAAETGVPQYQLIEEALDQYLASKRTK